jgi:hypothetical protein
VPPTASGAVAVSVTVWFPSNWSSSTAATGNVRVVCPGANVTDAGTDTSDGSLLARVTVYGWSAYPLVRVRVAVAAFGPPYSGKDVGATVREM